MRPWGVFHHGQHGGQISIDYGPGEARAAVQAALDRYYGEVSVAVGPEEKLRAIARVTRALQILQPFTDANSRVNVHVLMQKFLLEQGFRPSVLLDSYSLFLGGFTVGEIAERIKAGMVRFDQHVRAARWDGLHAAQPNAARADELAAAMGLTGGTPTSVVSGPPRRFTRRGRCSVWNCPVGAMRRWRGSRRSTR
ncbi:hypothetical protein NKH77_28820 [Streptomyces sp. M19]